MEMKERCPRNKNVCAIELYSDILLVAINNNDRRNTMGMFLIGVIGMIISVITTTSVGTLAAVFSLKEGTIDRSKAIMLMLAFYGIPSLAALFISESKKQTGLLGLEFAGIILMLCAQVAIGYFVGELVVRKKVLKYFNREDIIHENKT